MCWIFQTHQYVLLVRQKDTHICQRLILYHPVGVWISKAIKESMQPHQPKIFDLRGLLLQ